MGHLSRTIHVDSTPEQAFDLFTNLERRPEWHLPADIRVKDVTGPLDAVGAGYTVVSTLDGRRLEISWRVVGYDPPRLIEMKSTGSMIMTVRGHFEPAAGGTDVTLEGECERPLEFMGGATEQRFFEKAMLRDCEQSLANFKAIVEATVPVAV
jgi:uncharacterized protein YndB with AHSA1/START domain